MSRMRINLKVACVSTTFLGLVSMAVVLAWWPKTAWAQADSGWTINSFTSNIAIQSSGVVRVEEHIEANFLEPKHGIYRDIPISYHTQNVSQILYTKVHVISVSRNAAHEPYSIQQNGAVLRIVIGDANKTISGPQSYDITYEASGVLSAYDQYDELYWNVTGNSWGVPIAQASATVTLPRSGLVQFSCYEGVIGAVETCHASPKNGSTVQFASSRQLQPSEGLTVAVGYQKGMVPLLAVMAPGLWWQQLFQPWPMFSFAIAALIGLVVAGRLYWKNGRDWWWRNPGQLQAGQVAVRQPLGGHDSVVVEYTPPNDLPPGMLGLIKDERADTLDVTATIVDLAAKGYLTITELDKRWLFGAKDYELTRTEKDPAGLWQYEILLLERLFDTGTTVKLSSLKDTFYQDLADVKQKMYQEAVGRNWFVANPNTVRGWYLFWATAGFFVCVVAAWRVGENGHLFLAAILTGLAVGCLGLLVASLFMSQRTAQGHELYRRIKGYRLFIATAETYRQRFFEQQNLFTQVLPYAMMFGLTEKFAQAMKQIGYQPPAPAWYVGTAPFNPVAFGADMSGVSQALSSAMASAPSNSGSGGGGFSGGGFGGGGGGSW